MPEAVAAINTHGKKFFVAGREHVTSDDMFKGAEINRWTAEAAEMEKGKKSQVEYPRRCEAELLILEHLVIVLENSVGRLTSKELETLLW